MDKLELQVDLREAGGKGAARRTRATGNVPAVVYGIGADTITLQVDERSLSAIVRMGANQIIDLKGPDGFDDRLVLLKDPRHLAQVRHEDERAHLRVEILEGVDELEHEA